MAQELADKIRAAAQAKNIDPDTALAIARAESSLRADAKAGTSSAGGLFQVVDKTWKEFGGKPGKKFDPEENIRVGTDIIARNTQTLKGFLNRDPRPAEIYAAHYFGPTGAKSFLSADPATPIVDILGKQAVKANPNLQGKNVGQVMAQLETKMGTKQADVSRETFTPVPRRELPPSLPPMAAAPAAGKMADLGPSYQAALALSFLADTDDKEERDIDREPGVAEQWLAQQPTAPSLTAQFADVSIKSPFAEPKPQMLAEGGEVKPESTAAKMLKAAVPMDLRILGSTLMGNREPITEANFRPEELAAMQQAVDKAAARTGKTQKGSVQYVDYPRGEEIGPGFQPVGQTLGRFVYEKSPTGQTVITDRYDFYNEGRKANVEKYEKMGRAEKALSVSGNMLKNLVTGNLRQVPAELAEAYIGRDGREVRIQLPVKRSGGSPETGEVPAQRRPLGFPELQEPPREFSWEELRSRVREGMLTTPQSPFGMGLNLGYRGYKYFTGTQPLEDLLARAQRANRGLDPNAGMEPIRRSNGGPAELTAEEIAAASRPATVNPMIQRQGEAARRLAAMRDVNTLPDPRTYAAVSGFLGQAPDQQGFSAMHPDIQGIRKAGDVGFGVGTALQVAPLVGGATKVLGKAAGSALNERLLAGQSLTPGFNTPAPIAFAVKPRGGTFGYTGQSPGVSKLDYLMDEYVQEAKSAQAPSELQEFLKAKAPKYFSTTYGTAEDPLRTAIRERRIEPFGRDQSKLPPYLIDAAKFPQARGHLQAKLDLERMYDEMTGVRAYAYKPEGSAITERGIRQDISEKMGQEGVPLEARNPPSVDAFSAEDFSAYPTSSRMLRQLVENQETLPPNLRQALRTGEPIFDVDTNMFLLRPSNVIEALQQVPANKLKNMSFPEALIQGTQALAPIRDYRTAIDMADRGAKIPRQALDMFTQPVAEAPFIGGNWVQLTKPVATELEGKLMKHSVGGYGSGSSYGTGYTELPYGGKKAFDEGLVQVYSLRDKQGMPSVTVELAKSDKGAGDKWNVTQIRGRFNSEPPFQLREDIFRLLDKLDEEKGLNKIKGNTYNRTPTGEDIPAGEAPSVDWAQEYDQWLSGTAQ